MATTARASPKFGWGHVNVNVAGLDRSIAFYQLLGFSVFLPGIPYLGLSMAAEPASLDDSCADALGVAPGLRGRACIMGLGDGFPKLDLIELRAAEPSPPLANDDLGCVRLCLASRDLAADHAWLVDRGVPFLTAPVEARGGMADIALCRDPDGTLIELIQPHPERWSLSG